MPRFRCPSCQNGNRRRMLRSSPLYISDGRRFIVECRVCGYRWISQADGASRVPYDRAWRAATPGKLTRRP